MRRSIYNDYRPLRIVLLLLIVVLGLFIYMKCTAPCEHTGGAWEVTKEATCTENGLRHKVCNKCETPYGHESIAAKGHTPLKAVEENNKESTCTEGGSHDEVKYCKTCNAELERETVAHELLEHTPGKVQQEGRVESTHSTEGYYNDVVRCTECGYAISTVKKTIDVKGHDYTNWSVEYDEATGDYVFTGKCSCNESGNTIVFTDKDAASNKNLTITITYDNRYAPCCKNQYNVKLVYKYTFDGKTKSKTFQDVVEFEPEYHSIMVENVLDINGNPTVGFISIHKYVSVDEAGEYYDLGNAAIKDYFEVDPNSEWSVNGYNYGMYKCQACAHQNCQQCSGTNGADAWFMVRVYSAEHDKTKD